MIETEKSTKEHNKGEESEGVQGKTEVLENAPTRILEAVEDESTRVGCFHKGVDEVIERVLREQESRLNASLDRFIAPYISGSG